MATVSPGLAAAQPQPGSLDATFGSTSSPGQVTSSAGDGATGVAYDAADNGELAVASGSSMATPAFDVGMFTSAGAVDPTFASGFSSFPGSALAVTAVPAGAPNSPAGNVVAAGYIKPSSQTCGGTGPVPVIAEYKPAGTLVFTADLRVATTRTVSIFLTAGSPDITLTSVAAFSSSDVGATICGPGVPANTTIANVTSSTSATLSGSVALTTTVSATIIPVDTGQLNAVTVDASGDIVAAGQTTTSSGASEGLIVRLLPTGTLDNSFNLTGYQKTFAVAGSDAAAFTSVAVVPPVPSGYAPPTDVNDIVAGGYSTTPADVQELTVAAFSGTDGTPDTKFGTAGATQFQGANTATVANDLTVISATALSTPQPHLGDVVVVGTTSTGADLVEFQPDGTPDPSFGPKNGTPNQVPGEVSLASTYQLNAVAYQPFGGFLTVAGMSTTANTQPPPPQVESTLVGQYNGITGSPNTFFGTNGVVVEGNPGNEPESAAAVAVQPDGKTVVAGETPTVNGVEGTGLMRFTGPTVAVSNAGTLSVTEPISFATLNFTVAFNETLATSVCPGFAVSAGGGSVIPAAPCSASVPVPIPAGSLGATVTVQAPVTAAVGSFQVTTLTLLAGSGYVLSPTNASATGTIQNLAVPLASAQPSFFGATPTNPEVRGTHTPANGLNLYWENPNGTWSGRGVGGPGSAFSLPALTFTKQNLELMAVEGPSHSLWLYYERANGTWAAQPLTGANTTFSAPSLVVNSQNLEVITVEGPNHSLWLYYERLNGTWAGQPLTGANSTFSDPSLVLTAPSLEVIAVQGPNHSLWLYYERANGTWAGQPLTGANTTASGPNLVINHQGLEVIAVQSPANSLVLYYERANGTWAGQPLSGGNTTTSVPALVINDPGLEVIAVEGPGNTMALYYENANGTWGHRPIAGAGTTFSQSGMIINNQNLEVISAQGPSNTTRLYYESVNGTWNGPVTIAGAGSSG